MIKLIHILWDANVGGIQKLILQLAALQQQREEIDVEVLFLKTSGPLIEEFGQIGCKVHQLNIRSGYDIRPGEYSRLKAILKQQDIIHLHSYNPWVSRLAALSRNRIVYTEHGNFGFGRKRRLGEKVNAHLQAAFLRKHPRLITYNSDFSRRIAEARYGIAGRPSLVLYNGVDIEKVRLAAGFAAPEKGNDFVIGTTSRLAGGKRVSLLLDLVKDLGDEGNEISLWIVGDGPERNMLEARAKDFEIEKKVRFWGSQSNPAPFQAAMDVCIFPFANEAFGLVAVESMALGKPAIVLQDGGGLPELVRDISPDDVCRDMSEVKRRVLHYLRNPQDMEKLKPGIRKHAEGFDLKIMEEKLFAAYVSIV